VHGLDVPFDDDDVGVKAGLLFRESGLM